MGSQTLAPKAQTFLQKAPNSPRNLRVRSCLHVHTRQIWSRRGINAAHEDERLQLGMTPRHAEAPKTPPKKVRRLRRSSTTRKALQSPLDLAVGTACCPPPAGPPPRAETHFNNEPQGDGGHGGEDHRLPKGQVRDLPGSMTFYPAKRVLRLALGRRWPAVSMTIPLSRRILGHF